ncbi:MAG: YggS family pyridoxal phosphate-dependent enzyme [Thermoguttaceae bacterium]|nr:YggS family pyridoxal phosphate-dependent enzyme [Thermoguttaceae bacterium]MDW8079120.1 YggS family pyridoxal phosphate-dependent enzyme [Thermoguttaceae bacterium]
MVLSNWSEIRAVLGRNLTTVQERIAQAARRVGRAPEEISIVCVTKYVVPDVARCLVELGYNVLGESRPQVLWRKAEACAGLPVRWHLVGPLQRNKAKKTVPLVELIHSVDSLALLETLNAIAAQRGQPVDVLLEVNISGEQAKHGFSPQEMPAVVAQLANYPHVKVQGLMGMAGLEGGLSAARQQFALLRRLRDELAPLCPAGNELRELSMGMSGDFEVAVEEGATVVRLGSILYEGLPSECFETGG